MASGLFFTTRMAPLMLPLLSPLHAGTAFSALLTSADPSSAPVPPLSLTQATWNSDYIRTAPSDRPCSPTLPSHPASLSENYRNRKRLHQGGRRPIEWSRQEPSPASLVLTSGPGQHTTQRGLGWERLPPGRTRRAPRGTGAWAHVCGTRCGLAWGSWGQLLPLPHVRTAPHSGRTRLRPASHGCETGMGGARGTGGDPLSIH